jgi:hypothetical protein
MVGPHSRGMRRGCLARAIGAIFRPYAGILRCLVNGLDTTTEHDRKRIRQDILPAAVEKLAHYSQELESLGLTRAAEIIREHARR